jgi:hypothetical protein
MDVETFKLSVGGNFQMVVPSNDDTGAVILKTFHTPDANGKKLDKALREMKYGDYVLLTILKQKSDSLTKSGEQK